MSKLKTVSKLVKTILELDPQTRNSDSFLYFRVLELIGKQRDVDIHSMPVTDFLLNMHNLGFPPFESVRRTRQKIQADFPELAACDTVSAMRSVNEAEYRAYSLGVTP